MPAAAWGHAAGFFVAEDPYGDSLESAYETGSREFQSEPWWPAIIAFHKAGLAMQVETSLPSDDGETCNEVYERIWRQPGFLATWNTGKLFIYDSDADLICGGAA